MFVHQKVKVEKVKVINIARDLKVIDNKVLRVLKHVRNSYGNDSVISGAKKILIKRKDIFRNFFDTKIMKFEVKKEKVSCEEERPFTFYSHLQDDLNIAIEYSL